MKKGTVIFMLLSMLSGCATQSFVVNGGPGDSQEQVSHFFVAGLGQTDTIDAAATCGSAEKVVRVEAYQSFLNGLLSSLTWGIYAPRQAVVVCRS